jgi:hypothetical protein
MAPEIFANAYCPEADGLASVRLGEMAAIIPSYIPTGAFCWMLLHVVDKQRLIPSLIDYDLCAHSRMLMDIISLFQAKQQ